MVLAGSALETEWSSRTQRSRRRGGVDNEVSVALVGLRRDRAWLGLAFCRIQSVEAVVGEVGEQELLCRLEHRGTPVGVVREKAETLAMEGNTSPRKPRVITVCMSVAGGGRLV